MKVQVCTKAYQKATSHGSSHLNNGKFSCYPLDCFSTISWNGIIWFSNPFNFYRCKNQIEPLKIKFEIPRVNDNKFYGVAVLFGIVRAVWRNMLNPSDYVQCKILHKINFFPLQSVFMYNFPGLIDLLRRRQHR